MLRKAKSYSIWNHGLMIKDRTIDNDSKEEVSKMSEYSSTGELCVWYYPFTTNSKGLLVRSQGDVLFAINLLFLIMVIVIELFAIPLVVRNIFIPVWSITSKL